MPRGMLVHRFHPIGRWCTAVAVNLAVRRGDGLSGPSPRMLRAQGDRASGTRSAGSSASNLPAAPRPPGSQKRAPMPVKTMSKRALPSTSRAWCTSASTYSMSAPVSRARRLATSSAGGAKSSPVIRALKRASDSESVLMWALEVHHVQAAHGTETRQVETDDRGDVIRVPAGTGRRHRQRRERERGCPSGSADAKVLVVRDRSIHRVVARCERHAPG